MPENIKSAGGQAMIETIVVLFFLCLVFFSLFQYSDFFTTRMIMDHAAARAARAKSVGLNRFMVYKTALVATIPVSGKCLSNMDDGEYLNYGNELNRIPDFLAAETPAEARGILDYFLWDYTDVDVDESGGDIGGEVEAKISQYHTKFFDMDDYVNGEGKDVEDDPTPEVLIEGSFRMENQYPLYMNNNGL